MICLMYSDSHFSSFLSIFYTFLYIPFLQITSSILSFFRYILNPHQLPENHDFKETKWEMDLPVSRFQDLYSDINRNGDETLNLDEKDTCSICLIEFENDDLVKKLPRCGHVFHVECMEKWMDQGRFTCPLCRSLVFTNPSFACKKWDSSDLCILPAARDS